MGNRDRRGTRASRDTTAEQSGDTPEAQLRDRLTGVDDTLRALEATVDTLDNTVNALVDSLDSQTAPAERPYDLSQVIPADTPTNDPETDTWTIPRDGTVTKLILGWPDGTQQAAGIGLRGKDGESLVPAGPKGSKFVALNDKVLTFNLADAVAKNDTYTFEFVNTDEENDHFVNVIPILSRGE